MLVLAVEVILAQLSEVGRLGVPLQWLGVVSLVHAHVCLGDGFIDSGRHSGVLDR